MIFSFEALIRSGKPVLVDFFATWCGPCMAMMPLLDELKAELGDQVEFVKLDVDLHTELAVERKVMGVPTIVLFYNGLERWRQAGVLSKEALRKAIETCLS
jgi:thioredoxin 1